MIRSRPLNTPSPGFNTAAEFIAARLKKAGFESAGDNGSFFQRYTMRELALDTDAASISICNPESSSLAMTSS